MGRCSDAVIACCVKFLTTVTVDNATPQGSTYLWEDFVQTNGSGSTSHYRELKKHDSPYRLNLAAIPMVRPTSVAN